MTILKLPLYDTNRIIREFPDGCFVYAFDWDVSKQRCKRNTLPAYVKPIDVSYPQSSNPSRLYKMLYVHRLNGTRSRELPSTLYHVATTEQEALDNYKRLVEYFAKKRDQYIQDSLVRSEEYVKSLRDRATAHKIK